MLQFSLLLKIISIELRCDSSSVIVMKQDYNDVNEDKFLKKQNNRMFETFNSMWYEIIIIDLGYNKASMTSMNSLKTTEIIISSWVP